MLFGQTHPEVEPILKAWSQAIRGGDCYAFGFSKMLYNFAPPWRRREPEFPFKAIFDNNKAIHNTCLMGHNIWPPEKIGDTNGKIVVFSRAYGEIKNQLSGLGLVEGRDFIRWEYFWSLVSFYKYGELHFPTQATLYITDRCNLKCQQCEVGVPRIKSPRNASLAELAESLAGLFRVADSLMRLALMGGETLLHKNLPEVIELVGAYRHRISDLVLVTNGTIVPGDHLLEALKKNSIRLVISDYSESQIPAYERNLPRVLARLAQAAITPEIPQLPWWETRPTPDDLKVMASFKPEDWRKHYAACAPDCPVIIGNRLFHCAQALAVAGPGLEAAQFATSDLALDFGALDSETDAGRQEILWRLLGYSEPGFLSSCQGCLGRGTSLSRLVPKASQNG